MCLYSFSVIDGGSIGSNLLMYPERYLQKRKKGNVLDCKGVSFESGCEVREGKEEAR